MNTLLKNQVLKITFFLFCLHMFSCCEPGPKQDNAVVDTTTIPGQIEVPEQPVTAVGTKDSNESDIELVVEAGEVILDMGMELIENKRRKDSVLLSKREKMYAYQLGAPIKHEKLVMVAYQKLSDTKGVYVLKKSRKEYLLIKYENKEEAVLDQELEDFKRAHADEVIGEIKKIDLMQECGKRKKPFLSGKLKQRRTEIEIDCLSCDK